MKCIVCRNPFWICSTVDAYVSQKHTFESAIYNRMDAGHISETDAWNRVMKYDALLLFPGKEPQWVNGEPVCYVCYKNPTRMQSIKRRSWCCMW